jgi:hypothetical protein
MFARAQYVQSTADQAGSAGHLPVYALPLKRFPNLPLFGKDLIVNIHSIRAFLEAIVTLVDLRIAAVPPVFGLL